MITSSAKRKTSLWYVNASLIATLLCCWCFVASSCQTDEVADVVPQAELEESAGYVTYSGRSSKWAAVRYTHLQSYPVCEVCGTADDLHVHHIEPFHLKPELELHPANLITLCAKHHFSVGHDPDGKGPERPSWKKWNSNVVNDSKTWLK